MTDIVDLYRAVSESVLAKPPRYVSEYDARVTPWLESDLYMVICRPQFSGSTGRDFTPEQSLHHMTKAGAINSLDENDEWAMAVVKRPAKGKPEDVSKQFARDVLLAWIRDGNVLDRDKLPEFIGRHMTNDQIHAAYVDEVVR